jgi:hypothetical protein
MPGPGTSVSLKTLEPSFHQDLNGDGTIGISTATHPAPLVLASADAFHFDSHTVPAAQQAADSKDFFVHATNAGLDSAATFQWTHDALDPIGHDHTLQNQAQIFDLHATAVFIH